jgi:hypothetical protein
MRVLVFLALFVAVASACTQDPTVDPPAPTFVTGSITNTQISLNFTDSYQFSSVTYNFLSSTGYCDSNSTGTAWVSSLDTNACVYNRQATFPSNTALAQCFQSDAVSDPDYTLYTTTVQITTVQVRSAIRGTPQTRTTVTALKLQFRFATYLNVSLSNIQVFGFAVSLNNTQRQIFNDLTGVTHVAFFTSVNYPFMLTPSSPTSALISSTGPGASTYHVTNVATAPSSDGTYSCPNTVNVPCEQLWAVDVSNSDPTVCNYQGITLTFSFQLGCNPGYSGSCTAQATTVTAVVSLANNNFCTQIVQNVGLSAVLAAYSNSAYSVLATNFIYNQRAYFKAVVTASAGPSLENTNVVQVEIVSYNQRLLLTTADAAASPPTGSFIIDSLANNAANTASFSFLVSSTTVVLANPDQAQTATVSVLLRVNYIGLSGTSHHELTTARFALQDQSATLQPLLDVQVTLSENSGASTASSSSAISAMTLYVIGAVGGVLLVGIFIGAFIAYRRALKKIYASPAPNSSSSANLQA